MIFVDTNYFIRLIENDSEEQTDEVKKLFFDGAAGSRGLMSSEIVLFEIYWLMKSFYKKEKEELVGILRDVLEMRFIEWENEKMLTKAVGQMKLFGYDLEDSYNLAFAKKNKIAELASFDKKLQKRWSK